MKPDVAHEVDQTLRSIEGISKAEAPPFLYGKIMERMKQPLNAPVTTPVWVFRLAMAVILLFLLNLFSVSWMSYDNRPQHKATDPAHIITEEYFGGETLYTY